MSVFQTLKGKSVFVTGHTGFKGSWLCLWLHELGANVTGYSLEPPSEPNNFEVCRVRDLLKDSHKADVRDDVALTAAIRKAKPDVVFHLAAQSIVREGYKSPRDTFDVNVMGTVNVLESVREIGRPCVVVCVTTDKCYQNNEQVWGYREVDPMGERDPYGGSKGAAELAIRSYCHSFFPPDKIQDHGVKLASARAGNVIGGGDWKSDALIVDVFKALSVGEPVALRNPGAYRPWQHVLQALSGYLTLASTMLASDDPKYCSGWNFGPFPGHELAVKDLVDIFLEEWGGGRWVNARDPNSPREANILRLSIDKALWELNWRPAWDLQDILRETARWYKTYLIDQGSMHDLTLEQIRSYTAAFNASMKADRAAARVSPSMPHAAE